ncbi:MAG: hypothetical protein MUO34_00400 [Ignavibacteriaceae bacterium]|nr:hypothetical protein [Ignavibacteriaceae bacterium]
MMLSSKFVKLSVLAGIVIIFSVILFGYLFFEPYITEEEITITVINKEKFGNEYGKYFIFTLNEVFTNSDNYYHNKSNANKLYPHFIPGAEYKVKVVGIYLPFLPKFRNILSIKSINGIKFTEL